MIVAEVAYSEGNYYAVFLSFLQFEYCHWRPSIWSVGKFELYMQNQFLSVCVCFVFPLYLVSIVNFCNHLKSIACAWKVIPGLL